MPRLRQPSLLAAWQRLRELYLDGELDRAACDSKRAAALEQLAALPAKDIHGRTLSKKLIALLADVGTAWAEATLAKRNTIALQLFGTVVVLNRTVVAPPPRPS